MKNEISLCDETLLKLSDGLWDAEAEAHLARCPACRDQLPVFRKLFDEWPWEVPDISIQHLEGVKAQSMKAAGNRWLSVSRLWPSISIFTLAAAALLIVLSKTWMPEVSTPPAKIPDHGHILNDYAGTRQDKLLNRLKTELDSAKTGGRQFPGMFDSDFEHRMNMFDRDLKMLDKELRSDFGPIDAKPISHK